MNLLSCRLVCKVCLSTPLCLYRTVFTVTVTHIQIIKKNSKRNNQAMDNFFGCYLLRSESRKTASYVGFTVPERISRRDLASRCFAPTFKFFRFFLPSPLRYVGFQVNPRRRIRQHNGEVSAGANRTKRCRPWTMCFDFFQTMK